MPVKFIKTHSKGSAQTSGASNLSAKVNGIDYFVREHVSSAVQTSGQNYIDIAISPTYPVQIGNLLVVWIAMDNVSGVAPTVTTITKAGGETSSWVLLSSINPPVATSNASVRGELWAIKTEVVWPVNTPITITLTSAVTAKIATIYEYEKVSTTIRSGTLATFGTASATTTPPTVSNPSAPLAGDLVIGAGAHEYGGYIGDLSVGDTDSLNGFWLSQPANSTGPAGTAYISSILQSKVVNVNGVQTYDNVWSINSDAISVIVALVPDAVPSNYGPGVGETFFAYLGYDNSTASTPTVTLSVPPGETASWQYVNTTAPNSASAGSLITTLAWITTTVPWPPGYSVAATFSQTIVAKAIVMQSFRGVSSLTRGGSTRETTAGSFTNLQTSASPVVPQPGDLVISGFGIESGTESVNAVPTATWGELAQSSTNTATTGIQYQTCALAHRIAVDSSDPTITWSHTVTNSDMASIVQVFPASGDFAAFGIPM